MLLSQNFGRSKLLRFLANKNQDKKIVIGNIYRPPYNLRDSLNTFMMEFNSTLLEHHTNSQKYICVVTTM